MAGVRSIHSFRPKTSSARTRYPDLSQMTDDLGTKSRPLYRFLDKEEYARQFIQGRFRITTLSACRSAEGAERRDEKEGHLEHRINYMRSVEDPERFEACINQTGVVDIRNTGDFAIKNSYFEGVFPDCYLLCFTEQYAPERMEGGFGKWCVRIDDNQLFYDAVSSHMFATKGTSLSDMNRVRYSGRTITDYERTPVPYYLLKPIDGYSDQQEIRMIWGKVDGRWTTTPEPFLCNCPALASICTLIPPAK